MSDTRKREHWNPLLKSYPFSEKINAVSIGAETLFTRLVAQADDYGNYYGSPRMILASLFPHRWAKKELTETDVGHWRTELVTCTGGPLAALYTVGDSKYLHIINSRRRFRSDVSPDERFPREPANLEEKALSEYVTKAARRRIVNAPLDPDQDKTQTKTRQDQEEKKHISPYSSDFEDFWTIWKELKRAINKVGAWEAWQTTLHGRNGDSGHPPMVASALILAARNYQQTCEIDGTEARFVMHPVTFLGPKRRWEDYREPPERLKSNTEVLQEWMKRRSDGVRDSDSDDQ